ncbi:hypothetical protein [Methylogaea oryzae]|uniref:hypothetical protein n=1 Tax=Methylogaea oryzae TaxID=1295382 RepID=UPI0009E7632B|nr:hypothetical protein [Methylogaea oryzae]
MSTVTTDTRTDRLYQLLPAIYRLRDAEQGYPLQALLRVIAEQVNLIEDDIGRLCDNAFIETAEDWAVPYIGDLIGYRPVADTAAEQESGALNRVLVPRREVANTIRYRRRKGALSLLEVLAGDVAGWPARAVEFFKLLGWHQNLDHRHMERARTCDLRNVEALELLDGPFDRLAHSVDVRRIDSARSRGRYNIPSVGVFVWRLKTYTVSHTPAYCMENAGPHCCTFSVLGQDAPLFTRPEPETEPTHIAEAINLPVPVRRLAFERDKALFYGENRSFAIWAEGWAGLDGSSPVPVEQIIAADLSDWRYAPPANHIALDPLLGRFAFPPGQLPKKGVRVAYRYGFSGDLGGGEYSRTLYDPPTLKAAAADSAQAVAPSFYRVGSGQAYARIGEALQQWTQDRPRRAVIELTDSGVYVEPVAIELAPEQSLQLRAANRARPVIRLLDWQTDLPDALSVGMAAGSRLTLDGLLVTGRAVRITGRAGDTASASGVESCGAEVVIRHCTLVPGWALDCDCEPKRPAEPSLELYGVRAKVRIEHSILGSVQINQDEVRSDPLPLEISDSILDATAPDKEAIGAPGYAVAHAVLNIKRSTVFGMVDVHAIGLAENCVFNDCVNVARRQLGCMRFCYVPPRCRTPRRYHCQPDLAVQAAQEDLAAGPARDAPSPASCCACGRNSPAAATAVPAMASWPCPVPKKSSAAPRTNRKWAPSTTCSNPSGRPICAPAWKSTARPAWT